MIPHRKVIRSWLVPIVIQPFSWRWYADAARRCKLYDFKARCWTDFAGRPTAAASAEG